MRYALLIGNSQYENEQVHNLKAPGQDVQKLGEVLRTRGEFDVRTVIDGKKPEIEAALEQLFDRKRPDDVLLVHFSGHGELDSRGRLHLLPSDAHLDRDGRLRSTSAIPADLLHRLARDTHAGSKIILLDCCYSGAYADNLGTRSARSATSDLFRQVESRGSVIIAAAGETEQAFEPPSSDGTPQLAVFSQAVTEALEGEAADGDGDGWIDHKDLASYLDIVVPRSDRQRPTHFSLGVRGGLKLARAAAATSARKPKESTTATGVASRDRDVAGETTHDNDQWRRLLRYYRSCVLGEAHAASMPKLSTRDKQFAVLGGDRERLLVGAVEALALSGPAASLAGRASREKPGLRYGYPLVTVDVNSATTDRPNWCVAPLFTVDVELTADGRHIKRAGPVELNANLMDYWMDWSPQERDALVQDFRADWAQGDHAALLEKAKYYLGYAGIEPLQTLRPTALVDDLTIRHPRAGAHNTALLHTDEESAYTVGALAEDLDKGLAAAISTFSDTALCGLEGPSPSAQSFRNPNEILPVTPGLTNEAQAGIIRSAMSRRLTVATGPPGTGKSELVTGVVATAVSAGEKVLVASTNNTAVDVVVHRSNEVAKGAVVRTGNKRERATVAQQLRDLVAATQRPASHGGNERANVRTWQRECDDRIAELDRRAEAEHHLAGAVRTRHHLLSLLDRTSLDEVTLGALPDRTLRRRARQARRATAWGVFGLWDRILLGRRFGVDAGSLPAAHGLLGAEVEARRLRASLAALRDEGHVLEALRTAQQKHREHSTELLRSVLDRCHKADRDFLSQRANALASQDARHWPQFERLLRYVPAWATTALAARASIVPKPGLFDLVVIDEASQCQVAHMLPLLLRAKRALVIGDPHQLSHITKLERGHIDRAAAEAELSDEWLQERQLDHGRYSAYHAAAAAAGEVLWLDEHYRCHPEIARTVNEHVYGNRLRVLTDTRKLHRHDTNPVRWEHHSASCERTSDSSWRNPDEARRVADIVATIRAANGATSIGVVSPYRAQRQLVEGMLAGVPDVQVGTVHAFQGGERQAIVLSPVLTHGATITSVKRLAGNLNLWNVAFTRASATLVVVGDAGLWRNTDGLLATLLAQVENTSPRDLDLNMDEPGARLHQRLTVSGTTVDVGAAIGGHRADLVLRSGNRRTAVLLDRSGTETDSAGSLGWRMRQLLAARQVMSEASDIEVVRVPVWRCLDDLDALLDDLVTW